MVIGVLAAAGVTGAGALAAAAVVVVGFVVALKLARLEALERLHRAAAAELNETTEGLNAQLAKAQTVADEMQATVSQVQRGLYRSRRETEQTRSLTTEGLRLLRQETRDLGSRLTPDQSLAAIEPDISQPVLSIAIPAYNRPDELEACVNSIVSELADIGQATVEVWITDDQSPVSQAAKIAQDFAHEHSFIGFRQNHVNIGLERNLIEACRPCRGEYLWILGNDDLVRPGAIATVIDKIDLAPDIDVFLYDRVRVDRTGAEELAPTPGCIPDDVVAGEQRNYSSLLEFAEQTGLLSAFGFISTLVVRRSKFVSGDAEAYLGLTMYPQLGMLLEGLGGAPMQFNNIATVSQRTPTQPEKAAEALGTREESFMSSRDTRDPQWFGATLAALLQRVIDRSAVSAEDLARLPEQMFVESSLMNWIRRNRDAHAATGGTEDASVRIDADKLLSSTTTSKERWDGGLRSEVNYWRR